MRNEDEAVENRVRPVGDSVRHPRPIGQRCWKLKNSWTVRRMMVAVAAVAVGLVVLRPAYLYLDATCNGPYTRSYNRDLRGLAERAGLVGKTEADVIRVLGEPTEVWEYDQPAGRTTTLAYCPSGFAGLGTFQVHCRGGVVLGLANDPF